mmetsp:Transcript_80928/g.214856  ORF Transcript_80928/g.214856 Transcript_80928/m.214856 type:complete len:579 (-) Transcript_80928:322-2058(-)
MPFHGYWGPRPAHIGCGSDCPTGLCSPPKVLFARGRLESASSSEVCLHLQGERLAVGVHEAERDGRLPSLGPGAEHLLGDEGPHSRGQLEAVPGEAVAEEVVAHLCGDTDDWVDVLLVNGVHVGEALDVPGVRHGGATVEEAAHVVLLHVRVQGLVEVVRVHGLRLKAVGDGAKDQLLVGPAGHEVDATVAPVVRHEGQRQQCLVVGQCLVADLDARGQHLRSRLHAHFPVQLLEPRARTVQHCAGFQLRPVHELHALGPIAARVCQHLGHASVEDDVDALALAGLVDIPKAAGAIHVPATILVDSPALSIILLDEVSRLSVELRVGIRRQRREALGNGIGIHDLGLHAVLVEALVDRHIGLLGLAKHPQGPRVREVGLRLVAQARVVAPVLVGIDAVQGELHGVVEGVEGAQEASAPAAGTEAERGSALEDGHAQGRVPALHLVGNVHAHDAGAHDDDVGRRRRRRAGSRGEAAPGSTAGAGVAAPGPAKAGRAAGAPGPGLAGHAKGFADGLPGGGLAAELRHDIPHGVLVRGEVQGLHGRVEHRGACEVVDVLRVGLGKAVGVKVLDGVGNHGSG